MIEEKTIQEIAEDLKNEAIRKKKTRSALPKKHYQEKKPPYFQLSDLDCTYHIKIGALVDMCHQWIDKKKDLIHNEGKAGHLSMVLCGPTGIGKTHVAQAMRWAMCRGIEENGEFIPMVPYGNLIKARDLINLMREENGYRLLSQGNRILGKDKWGDNVLGNWCLAVDDVGDEGNIEFVSHENEARAIQSWYSKIVDTCYKNTSLIITSNLSLNELKSHVGARAWDRLLEMAPKGYMRDLSGIPSYRAMLGGRGR